MPDTTDIIFVHPRGSNWIPGQKDISSIANTLPPLGLLNLASWLDKHHLSYKIFDFYAYENCEIKLLDECKTNPPRFIGFSTTTSSFFDGINIASKIKQLAKNIRIIFGGVHISALRNELLEKFPEIDFGIVGEGEQTLLELLRSDGQNPRDIPGVLYREGENVLFSGPRSIITDIDEIPFPAYKNLPGFPSRYKLPLFNYPKTPNTTAITSRGCPYSCAYCDRSVFEKTYRFHSDEYIYELLKYLKKDFQIRHVNFYDDIFTLEKKRLYKLLNRLIESPLNMTFNCAGRTEHIDKDLIKLLKKAGCWMISLGIETADSKMLHSLRKGPSAENLKSKIRLINSFGIKVKGLFMIALPGETESSINNTLNYILELPFFEVNVTKFTPFPGSPLYNEIIKYGTFDENWKLMNCLNFTFIPNGLSKEYLERRHLEIYKKYYSRPSKLLHYLYMIYESPDSWLRFLKNFKEFFFFSKNYTKN